jgi:sec-independent protein translocase protein TatB
MFDFAWSHILLFLIVALVVVGPKDLPRLMRIIGQWMGKARAMADQFKRSFDDMARQAELDELRKEIEQIKNERPLAGLEQDLHQAIIPDDMRGHIPPPQSVHAGPPPEPDIAPDVAPEDASPYVPEPPHDVPDPAYGVAEEPVAAHGYSPPAP